MRLLPPRSSALPSYLGWGMSRRLQIRFGTRETIWTPSDSERQGEGSCPTHRLACVSHMRLPRAAAAVVMKVADISWASHRNAALGRRMSSTCRCTSRPPSTLPRRFSICKCSEGPGAKRRETRLTSSGSSTARDSPEGKRNARGSGSTGGKRYSAGLCGSCRSWIFSKSLLDRSVDDFGSILARSGDSQDPPGMIFQ